MKRLLLGLLTLVLAVLVGVAAFVWYRRPYLDPKQLLETVRGRIEESIGRPVEFESAKLAGLEGIELTDFRIPSAEWDGASLSSMRTRRARAGNGWEP